jgi:hypothetical protein
MANTSSITGGCYCGKVRYRANGPTLYQANCHCANCRRAVGAQAVAWITVKLSEFTWEMGTPKRYRTSTSAYRTFCDSCGTSLTYENDERPMKSTSRPEAWMTQNTFLQIETSFPEEKLSWAPLISDR